MHFSEDDLRAALKQKDPGAQFTQRVMDRIHQSGTKAVPADQSLRSFPSRWWSLRFRVTLAGTLAACLAISGWLGVMHYRKVQESRAGELARREAILALRITTAKLNHVLERVKAAPSREVKLRRESL